MQNINYKSRKASVWAGGALFFAFCLLLSGGAGRAALAGPDRIVLEDFSKGRVGEFPPGWGWRDKDDDKPKRYTIQQEDGCRHLNAKDDGLSVMIIKKTPWNLRDYPILTWRWRVKALPNGGDERVGEKNDSAAGLYVIFSQNWFRIPKSIKYVWSTTLPVGTVADRKLIGRPRVLVLRSGKGRVGEWVTERVDLYEDYKRVWGGEPDEKTVGIAILTDADVTHTFAEADYGDIVVSKE